MVPNLSILLILLCSLLCAFHSVKSQFIHNSEQSLKHGIGVDLTFSHSSSLNAKILDVQKLNKLISFIDKTWILPFPIPGTNQTIGSNFKHRETCANIYETQRGACQQIGFGTICFNYCYEKGETMEYQCENIADSAYCENNSIFDSFLKQYQNEPNKAKIYIRQMISRCYATAICDTQYGILNATILDGNNEDVENVNVASTTDINNQPKTPKMLKIQEIKPIPIWQLLLLRNRMIPEAKSTPNMKAIESNASIEIANKEDFQKYGNSETTGENNAKEVIVKNTSQNTQETTITTTTTTTKQTISRKDEKEAQLQLICKALQQINKNINCFSKQ